MKCCRKAVIHGYVACVENAFSEEIPILCDDLNGVQDNDREENGKQSMLLLGQN